MHIALVHRDLHVVTRGGIGTVYRALAPRLRHAGHHVTLLTQDCPNPLILPGVDTRTLPRTDDLAAHRAAVAEALSALRGHRGDVPAAGQRPSRRFWHYGCFGLRGVAAGAVDRWPETVSSRRWAGVSRSVGRVGGRPGRR